MTNRPSPRHRHKYPKYKMCLSLMTITCIKQHLGNILSSIHEKLSNTESELEKRYGNQESIVFFNINSFSDFQELLLIHTINRKI